MTLVFPSADWFERYGELIDADEVYAQTAADWGVDFDGDFLFVMTDVPVDDLDVESIPEDLRTELETYIVDGVGYGYLGLEGGACTGARLVEHDDPVVDDVGFRMTATYETWSKLVGGEMGAIDGLMTGEFDLEGDMQKVLAASDAATRLTDIAAEIDAETITERYA